MFYFVSLRYPSTSGQVLSYLAEIQMAKSPQTPPKHVKTSCWCQLLLIMILVVFICQFWATVLVSLTWLPLKKKLALRHQARHGRAENDSALVGRIEKLESQTNLLYSTNKALNTWLGDYLRLESAQLDIFDHIMKGRTDAGAPTHIGILTPKPPPSKATLSLPLRGIPVGRGRRYEGHESRSS